MPGKLTSVLAVCVGLLLVAPPELRAQRIVYLSKPGGGGIGIRWTINIYRASDKYPKGGELYGTYKTKKQLDAAIARIRAWAKRIRDDDSWSKDPGWEISVIEIEHYGGPSSEWGSDDDGPPTGKVYFKIIDDTPGERKIVAWNRSSISQEALLVVRDSNTRSDVDLSRPLIVPPGRKVTLATLRPKNRRLGFGSACYYGRPQVAGTTWWWGNEQPHYFLTGGKLRVKIAGEVREGGWEQVGDGYTIRFWFPGPAEYPGSQLRFEGKIVGKEMKGTTQAVYGSGKVFQTKKTSLKKGDG